MDENGVFGGNSRGVVRLFQSYHTFRAMSNP